MNSPQLKAAVSSLATMSWVLIMKDRASFSASSLLLLLILGLPCVLRADEVKPRALIEEMSQAVGGMEKLRSLRDVEYKYTYRDKKTGKADISTERYVFNGELSWAQYLSHDYRVFPNKRGTVIQGYNGRESWVALDGKLISDPQAVKMAGFNRKTNFYWFAMMFKLLDPGVTYKYEGTRKVTGKTYDLVKIGFESGVGAAQDTYLLYLNRDTHLVDQFLFTVMDFGIRDPLLMKVTYKEFNGLKLPVYRTYIASSWQGEIKGDSWTEEIMEEIKFNNGFELSLFNKPASR
jgi:hypothetical protein